jgi:hypothetical protein
VTDDLIGLYRVRIPRPFMHAHRVLTSPHDLWKRYYFEFGNFPPLDRVDVLAAHFGQHILAMLPPVEAVKDPVPFGAEPFTSDSVMVALHAHGGGCACTGLLRRILYSTSLCIHPPSRPTRGTLVVAAKGMRR